jgi:hypothetical protein
MGQPADERRPVILAAESYDDRGVPGSLVGDVVDPWRRDGSRSRTGPWFVLR